MSGVAVTEGQKHSTEEQRRRTLLDMYDAAVRRAHPSRCLPEHLPEPPANGRIIIVGAGKASAAMAVAAEQFYRKRSLLDRITGFVTTGHGYTLPTDRIEIIEAGHPVPDAGSAAAADRALALAQQAGPDDIVLVLLSGGASALWSAPAEGVSFGAKQALTRELLKSGARIHDLNCVRKHLSRIKGGKLAAAAYPGRVLTLAISDVPGDERATIGSGPTVGDPTTLADARSVLHRFGITPASEIAAALDNLANETPKPGSAVLAASEFELIAAPKASLEAAAEVARSNGYRIENLGDALEGEAREVARLHAVLAKGTRDAGERVVILSGGELTVTVRGSGSGGPNQEYALGLVLALDGAQGVAALAADTDGIDGGAGSPEDPAGALVFPNTKVRASALNLDAATFLANNDSTTYFRALGDLVLCGPTQTNVNDFRAILIDP